MTKRLLLTTLLLLPALAAAQLSDVPATHPHADAITYVQRAGVVDGYPDGTYRPDADINRVEFLKILLEATDTTVNRCRFAGSPYSDTEDGAWYMNYVYIASCENIVDGYPDGTFKPANTINYAEATKIIFGVYAPTFDTAENNCLQSGYPNWYDAFVCSMSEFGVTPRPNIKPEDNLTRGEMAQMIYSLSPQTMTTPAATTATATFAGGCFWCMEPAYQETNGVIDAVVGFSGGSADDADYTLVAGGKTAHREVVQVTYDPSVISYDELLHIFWRQIDPTDAGGQFADRGFQYTTAIYSHTPEQKAAALAAIAALDASQKFDKPVATVVEDYAGFWLAGEYHQDFYINSAAHYERYKEGSGRADFISENWAKDAALQWEQDQQVSPNTTAKADYDYTPEEIEALLADLDPLAYHVVAENGTEAPFNNAYWDNKADGIYVDKVTGKPLFSSTHKYDSGTGWPSFWRTIDDDSVTLHEDNSLSVTRTEVRSAVGHVGHVFDDGPEEEGGRRFCTNSASLRFVPVAEMDAEGYGDYLPLFE